MESTYEFIVERHTIPGINLETGQIISSMTYYLFLKILERITTMFFILMCTFITL